MPYASASTRGFYVQEIHGSSIPDDAIEISEELHSELLNGQDRGLLIDWSSGIPTLAAAPETPPKLRIAERRYQAETAGITVNGMALPTDRDSQALVTGAALAAVIDPNYTCQWKTAEGFVDMSAQQIIALASAMRAHVQACFDREAALLAAVDAGTYSGEQLDQGWPA